MIPCSPLALFLCSEQQQQRWPTQDPMARVSIVTTVHAGVATHSASDGGNTNVVSILYC